jgi:hypothetical protein
MGLFDGMFGQKHADLDPSGTAAGKIAEHGDAFESFATSANDRIEVVVGDGSLYAFIGKPPKAFGLLWFDGDGRHDVRSMMESKAMTREAASQLVGELPAIYSRHGADERFSYKVGSKGIIVTPSAAFHAEIQQAVARAQG